MMLASIDVGCKNVGICILNYNIPMNIICIKDNWTKLSYDMLNIFYDTYKLYLVDLFILEEQRKGRKNVFNYGFIMSFFESKNKKVISVKPPCFNLHISSYRNRKKYTVDFFKNVLQHSNKNVFINKYKKIDDIADSLYLAFKYINCIDTIPKIDTIQIL